MSNRVINLRLATFVCLSFLPMYACSNGDDDGQFNSFGSSFSSTVSGTMTMTTAATTVMDEEESGDGDDDTTSDDTTGDGDGDSTGDGDGDGDGDEGDGDGDGNDTDCPVGQFGCPCDNGQCAPGLQCENGTCVLGGGDGDGDPTGDGDGDGDPYNPNGCAMPDLPAMVGGIAGSFCAPPCTVDADCPAGPIGTQGLCLLLVDMNPEPTNCVLICDPLSDTCPVGASCKDVPDQPGVGVCTYP